MTAPFLTRETERSASRYSDRLEILEEENRQLRERIAKLEGRDEIEHARRVFGLTHSEAAMFVLLLRFGSAPYETMADAVYHGQDEPSDIDWALRTHMKRMRKKTRPLGIDFETVYSMGYRMSDEARKTARLFMGRPS